MSIAFSRLIGLFETARQIDTAVRAAEEFERARDGREPRGTDAEKTSSGIPL